MNKGLYRYYVYYEGLLNISLDVVAHFYFQNEDKHNTAWYCLW